MKIILTEDRIKKGKRNDGIRCPIALAIMDAMPGHDVWVTDRVTHIKPSNGISFGASLETRVFINTPEMKSFLLAFDVQKNGTAAPFAFDLPVE